MSQTHRFTRNLWALTVLSLLRERPTHPYDMQRQIGLRHQGDLLALKRGSLYHAIERLQQAGLIEPVETNREGRWPERTVYRLTPAGEDELLAWLRELLATPAREPSRFTAALAHLYQLTPEDALEQLLVRAISLEAEVAALESVVRSVGELVGRTSILEVEYARAMRKAELAWVRSLIDDLQSRGLAWDVEELRQKLSPLHRDADGDVPIEEARRDREGWQSRSQEVREPER